MRYVPRHTNATHIWAGDPVRKVCICLPTSARKLPHESTAIAGVMCRIFEINPHPVTVHHGGELAVTVYTGQGEGHGRINDEAQLWALRWSASIWNKFLAEEEKMHSIN